MLRAIAILLLATAPALAERAKRCDATELQDEGMTLYAQGNTAAAYYKFAAAAKCRPGDRIHELAAMSACTLFKADHSELWIGRAKYFIAKLPAAKRDKLRRFCTAGCGGPGVEWTNRD